MRKVIYKEWVRGIETEEYKQWKKAGDPPPIPQPYVDGTNCYIEKEGLFHGFFPTAMENNDGSFGNFTEALIELEDGSMANADPSLIRFIDSPENEQLAEFAKAAMQGLLANTVLVQRYSGQGIRRWISEHAILQAKSMINELNKQK